MITNSQIEDIKEKIAKGYKPERIYLFGSYANGYPDQDSDLDFIIVKETNLPKHKRGWEIRKFLFGLKVPMDLKVYTPAEFENEKNNQYSFLFSAMKGSKLLYG